MIYHVLPSISYLNDGTWKLKLNGPPPPDEKSYHGMIGRIGGWHYEETFPSEPILDWYEAIFNWYEARDYVDSIMTQLSNADILPSDNERSDRSSSYGPYQAGRIIFPTTREDRSSHAKLGNAQLPLTNTGTSIKGLCQWEFPCEVGHSPTSINNPGTPHGTLNLPQVSWNYSDKVIFRSILETLNEWNEGDTIKDIVDTCCISIRHCIHDEAIVVIIQDDLNYYETHYYPSPLLSSNSRTKVEEEFTERMTRLIDSQ